MDQEKLRPATLAEHKNNFRQAIIGCDEVLSKHIGPMHPVRAELAKLMKKIAEGDKPI